MICVLPCSCHWPAASTLRIQQTSHESSRRHSGNFTEPEQASSDRNAFAADFADLQPPYLIPGTSCFTKPKDPLAGPQGHSGASNVPGDAHVLTEWLEMRTQDTFLGVSGMRIGSFRRLTDETQLAIANLKFHPASPPWRVQQAEEEGNIRQGPGSAPDQACGSSCRYTDGRAFFTARFSNTSDFLLQKKYGCSRVGRYPMEGISHEEDGSSDACNSGASKRRVNFFLCRRRGSDPHVFTGALQRELTRFR